MELTKEQKIAYLHAHKLNEYYKMEMGLDNIGYMFLDEHKYLIVEFCVTHKYNGVDVPVMRIFTRLGIVCFLVSDAKVFDILYEIAAVSEIKLNISGRHLLAVMLLCDGVSFQMILDWLGTVRSYELHLEFDMASEKTMDMVAYVLPMITCYETVRLTFDAYNIGSSFGFDKSGLIGAIVNLVLRTNIREVGKGIGLFEIRYPDWYARIMEAVNTPLDQRLLPIVSKTKSALKR